MISKRKAIALMLVLVALTIDAYGMIVSSAPMIHIPVTVEHVVSYWGSVGFPVVELSIDIMLSAQGALSVNNPVHVHATFRRANVTDLLQYYNQIGFSGAYNKVDATNPESSHIPIKATTGTEYEADGDAIWLREGSTWVFLLPNLPATFTVRHADIEKGGPVATISSVTDTLTIQNNVLTQRLTWILIGFSVLMLQPILGALLLSKRPAEQEHKQKPA